MYLEHFGFAEHPFRLTPDSKFLFLSKVHSRAKAYMEYTIWNRDSFVVITGEIGSGKTTLIQKVLSELNKDVVLAKIHQTQLAEVEFLQALLVEFGFEPFKAHKVELISTLNKFLRQQHERGKRVVLVVDEAQNLNRRVLEEVRLLSGLETGGAALLNVILVGQPELNALLDAPGMEQLVQRIRLRFHLDALSQTEMQEYIKHRQRVAGREAESVFPADTMSLIYEYTNGIPRLVNILCDTSLTVAFVDEEKGISQDVIQTAVEELQWKPFHIRFPKPAKFDNKAGSSAFEPTAKLVVQQENDIIGEYLLNKQSMTVGRNPDNEVQIADSVISGYHARIISCEGRATLYDLNSTNGTYVNGKKVRKCSLNDGDLITITRYHIRFASLADSAAANHVRPENNTIVLENTLALSAANESAD
jgi:type II secretory pathway predicted ATPase ExeA